MECTVKSRGSVLKCVEELLDPSVTPTKLLQASQLLSQAHYDDVVEERNIINLCGYPLCGKSLGRVTQQKYHISIARRQVIDLSERKKFCSNDCFKSSKYFSAQLAVQPLWSQDSYSKVEVKLLDYGVSCQDSQSSEPISSQGLSSSLDAVGSLEIPLTENTCSSEETDLQSIPIKMSALNKLLLALSTWHAVGGHGTLTSSSRSENVKPMSTSGREGEEPFLPPVDKFGQIEQRRKIVYHQVNRNLPTVCAELSVNHHEAHPAITGLINTFRFERNCITFHPKEWKVLITVLLVECGLFGSFEELMERHRVKVTEWLTDIQASLDDLCTMIRLTARTDE